MNEEKIREAIKETQGEMYEYVKALNLIGNAADKTAEIEFNSTYSNDFIKSMIDTLVVMIKDRADELFRDFGIWESEETGSLFKFMDDPRFIEYKSQVELDGGNITDILESWLKEHNPDYLKED